ncbi:MAG: NAD-dependent epimerase/dehydratase family protein [Actinomycetota bacterium]
MKILFTGATGVLGRAAVPRLVEDGHDVIAVSRSPEGASWLEEHGARPEAVELFDPSAVDHALPGVDTVVHFATAIPPMSNMTKRKSWEMNDRLRSEATGILVDAAIANDVSRFVQQSVTFAYRDGGETWLDENSEMEPGWDVLDSALDAEAHVNRFRTAGGTGVTLRLSRLYGPGKVSGDFVAGVADRKVPVVGAGDNYVSSIHVADVASALAAAMNVTDGTYNVGDDEPVTSAVYTDTLADLIDAPRPRRIPPVVARLAVGRAVTLLTTSQRVSNQRFREATDWTPAFPSVREGWRDVVDANQRQR